MIDNLPVYWVKGVAVIIYSFSGREGYRLYYGQGVLRDMGNTIGIACLFYSKNIVRLEPGMPQVC